MNDNGNGIDPQEALRAAVRIRGFQEGGNRTPVEAFRGRLMNVSPRMDTSQSPARVFIDLKYDRCVIIRTNGDPYPYETVELSIKQSDKQNSAWGLFATSLAQHLDEKDEIWDCVGAVMELDGYTKTYGPDRNKFIPDPAGGTNPDGTTKMVNDSIKGWVWVVKSVEGKTAGGAVNTPATSAAFDKALDVLDGKTLAEFNNEVWQDPMIKSDQNLAAMLLNGQFIPMVAAGGRVTVDERGIHHVAVVAVAN